MCIIPCLSGHFLSIFKQIIVQSWKRVLWACVETVASVQVFACVCVRLAFFSPLMRDVFVTVCACMKGILTDTGAEVSILSVGPVVVGVAVVAAHCLQLDLLDLHGLCDGCVGSCCRRCCQAWREEAEETVRLQTATCLLWLSHCTCETFQKASLANKKNEGKRKQGGDFWNNKTMNNFIHYGE